MKKSGNLGRPGNGSLGMHSLATTVGVERCRGGRHVRGRICIWLKRRSAQIQACSSQRRWCHWV